MAKILLPDTYLMRFNSPRTSRHELKRERFPDTWRRIWRPLHGVAVWNPLQKFDLMHSFFKIPFTKKPWILSFSSFVPRTIGKYEKLFREVLRDRLLEDNCRKLIACSNFAKREFALFNHDWSGLDQAMRKLEVIHPNLPVQVTEPKHHAGARWVRTYEGEITPSHIEEALKWALNTPRPERAPLDALDSKVLALRTIDAYKAIATNR